MRILIVDDDPASGQHLATTLRTFLVALGDPNPRVEFRCQTESNLAWDFLLNENCEWDMVITDWDMPKMKGVELVKHIRARFAGIVTMLISGDHQAGELKRIPKEEQPHHFLERIDMLVPEHGVSRILEGMLRSAAA